MVRVVDLESSKRFVRSTAFIWLTGAVIGTGVGALLVLVLLRVGS
jgi:hypothetical protein